MLLLSFAAFSVSTDIAVAPSVHAQSVEDIEPVATAGTSTVTVVQPKKMEDPLACNCWKYQRSLNPNFPTSDKIIPNISAHVGAIAVFDYPHYGLVVAMDKDGFFIKDSNFKKCTYQTHYMRFDNPHLIGFFNVDAMN